MRGRGHGRDIARPLYDQAEDALRARRNQRHDELGELGEGARDPSAPSRNPVALLGQEEARTAVACCPGMGARSRIARWKASQNDFQALKGAFRNLVVVRAAQLSRVIARHTGERRVDVYERLITRWTEPLARQTVTLRNLLMVILPTSTGELVKLELGEEGARRLACWPQRDLSARRADDRRTTCDRGCIRPSAV